MLVPVLYAIFVLDLGLITWTKPSPESPLDEAPLAPALAPVGAE